MKSFGNKRAVSQTTSFWDKVVFKTVKQTLGGNLKLLISGSSQISSTVLNFMRSSFGCLVRNGFLLLKTVLIFNLSQFIARF